jgi:hypothetical protein
MSELDAARTANQEWDVGTGPLDEADLVLGITVKNRLIIALEASLDRPKPADGGES